MNERLVSGKHWAKLNGGNWSTAAANFAATVTHKATLRTPYLLPNFRRSFTSDIGGS